MNINQAKAIPLAQILEKLGYSPTKIKNGEAMYFSPFRTEKTPSFHVNNANNIWYDFGEGQGGSIIDFACVYLSGQQEANTIHDALRWINNMTRGELKTVCKALPPPEKDPSLAVKKTSAIKHKALIVYLAKRGIPVNLASSYLVQVDINNRDSGKSFFALGMLNEDEGYELRNPFFKGSAGTKTITFIRGTEPKPDGIHLFEGMFDYLSLLSSKNTNQLSDDTIVLHSLSCIKQAIPYIKNYGYRRAYTWLDNDQAGEKATQILAKFFQTEECLQHKPMNKAYHPHKDVSAWHMHSLNL